MRVVKYIPHLAFAAVMVGVAMAAMPAGTTRGLDIEAFGRLPVLEGGRVKPIDSVARNSLLMIRSQQSFRFTGKKVGATEWLLDVMFRPVVARNNPCSSSTIRTCSA